VSSPPYFNDTASSRGVVEDSSPVVPVYRDSEASPVRSHRYEGKNLAGIEDFARSKCHAQVLDTKVGEAAYISILILTGFLGHRVKMVSLHTTWFCPYCYRVIHCSHHFLSKKQCNFPTFDRAFHFIWKYVGMVSSYLSSKEK